MTTDETGAAATANDLLPYGEFEILEKTPPTGYLNTGVIRQTFAIRDQGVIVSLKTSAMAIKNNVIRGGVEIEKWDIERDERAVKQGDATLAGTVLEIWNRSAHSVVVDGTEYAPGAVVYTMTTDADGWAGTPGNLLPYGSFEILEKTPPTGYLNTGIIRQSFQIREEGVIIDLKGKVFCAHCGHPMHRHRQNKDGVYWFRCESQWKYKGTACVQVSVKEAEVKTEILATLHKQAEAILGRCIRLEREDDGIGEARLREISRQLEASGHFRKSLYESMVSGLITEDELFR